MLWFRRDLRLGDHPALAGAVARGGPVLALFVVDPRLRDRAGANRQWFLAGCLAALHDDLTALGGELVVAQGDPVDVVPAVARAAGAPEVWCTADSGPYGRRRDDQVARALDGIGAALIATDSPYAVAPGTIRKGDGTPYRVFTPFAKAWRAHGWAEPVDAPTAPVDWVTASSIGDLARPLPHAPTVTATLPEPGEAAAHRAAEAFLEQHLAGYGDGRDRPDRDTTSRLSPYLKFGCLHPRQLLDRLDRSPDADRFAAELCWREFYADVLLHRPDSVWQPLQAGVGSMHVDTGAVADERFEAWCAGRTGYPFVDAGMRQLLAEGWMHNRVRMVVASFLVKDLHLPWQRGASWFLEQLVDGDLASNQHGWQWVAGTGTDAAPYFRIFNPVSQGLRFDPDGEYVRRWVPELRGLAGADAHQPWEQPLFAGSAYPAPIVDHAAERDEALARLEATRR